MAIPRQIPTTLAPAFVLALTAALGHAPRCQRKLLQEYGKLALGETQHNTGIAILKLSQ
jgi:hypothetical protein